MSDTAVIKTAAHTTPRKCKRTNCTPSCYNHTPTWSSAHTSLPAAHLWRGFPAAHHQDMSAVGTAPTLVLQVGCAHHHLDNDTRHQRQVLFTALPILSALHQTHTRSNSKAPAAKLFRTLWSPHLIQSPPRHQALCCSLSLQNQTHSSSPCISINPHCPSPLSVHTK